jgi:diguanylate cyclase (GGDEF)-like protein
MNNTTDILTELAIIDCAIFVYIDNQLQLVYGNNPWVSHLSAYHPQLPHKFNSEYLNELLIDLADYQANKTEQSKVDFGIWSESIHDKIMHFRAEGIKRDEQSYLVIHNIENQFLQQQQTLQIARELQLTHEAVLEEHSYLSERLSASLRQNKSLHELQHPLTECIEKLDVGVLILSTEKIPFIQNSALNNTFHLKTQEQKHTPYSIIDTLLSQQDPHYRKLEQRFVAWQGEVCWQAHELVQKWLHISISPVFGLTKNITHWIILVTDVSQVKYLRKQNLALKHGDPLTDLANRQQLLQQLNRCCQAPNQFWLYLIDIKQFKQINRQSSFETGDALLKVMAERLKSLAHADDFVARINGDQFALVVKPDTLAKDRVAPISPKTYGLSLANTLNAAVKLKNNQTISVKVAIGISSHTTTKDSADILLQNADFALHKAKQDPLSAVIIFHPSLREQYHHALALEEALATAITQEQLELFIQPIIDVTSGRIILAEALTRWRDQDNQFIPPDKFIKLAETSGLIIPLGRWLIDKTCSLLESLQEQNIQCPISFNLSPQQLTDLGLLDYIRERLTHYRISTNTLSVELTENLFIDNYQPASELLNGLRSLGIGIAIDDFGTGFSSLSYLKHLPIDHLKIDGSFIRDLPQNSDDKAIVLAILALAKSLHLTVTAECVENKGQLRFLKNNHCDNVQGYLYSPAIPFDEFVKLYRNLTTG